MPQNNFLLHHKLFLMRTIIFFTSFFFAITGCSKTEQPSNFSPKLLWKAPLLNGSESFSFNPVVYKDWVIYGSKYARLDHYEKPKVIVFNKNTGEKVWEWNDAQSEYESNSAYSDTYVYQNIFVMSTGARVYAIDLNTGKSIWTTKDPESGNMSILGVGEKIYHVRNAINKKQDILCKANVLSGSWEIVHKVEKENKYASIGSYKRLSKDDDGKTYLYFTASYVDLNFTESEVHLMKLDTETDKIVLDKILTNTNTLVAIDDKRVYLAGEHLIGLDKKTGEILKEYLLPPLPNYPYHPGICIVNNNKLFAPTNYPRFICYDTENTTTLWSEDGISTSAPSRLLYHDGVVYYTSGSDGNLHAINENGKRLWKAASPDRKAAGDGIFDDPITIDEKENRIYLSTFYSACCYETIKK
jgi:outer membrane protein assembly factor BamB